MPSGSGSSTPTTIPQGLSSTSASTALSPFKRDLMNRLDIPLALAERTDGSLHTGYQKYKAFLQASETLARLWTAGEWAGKRPSVTDLIEIFQSKSMWHAHHAKAFSKVADYPEMVLWLEKDKDAPSNIGIWGYEKAVYNFKDLFAYIESKGKLGQKGKGKMKAKNESAGGSGSKKKTDKKKKVLK
jgi:hypothetical protein